MTGAAVLQHGCRLTARELRWRFAAEVLQPFPPVVGAAAETGAEAVEIAGVDRAGRAPSVADRQAPAVVTSTPTTLPMKAASPAMGRAAYRRCRQEGARRGDGVAQDPRSLAVQAQIDAGLRRGRKIVRIDAERAVEPGIARLRQWVSGRITGRRSLVEHDRANRRADRPISATRPVPRDSGRKRVNSGAVFPRGLK